MSAKEELFITKMRKAGMAQSVIDLFCQYYDHLAQGNYGKILEEGLEPVSYGSLPKLQDIVEYRETGEKVLSKCAIIKLNGGLGTSMGLSGPKSFLPVKDDNRFIDIATEQVRYLHKESGCKIPFILMNSSVTRTESDRFMENEEDILRGDIPFSFIHNSHPKVVAETLEPATQNSNPAMEWNPAGHGDIYTALHSTTILDKLLEAGIEYCFISNIDNLGATFDLSLLGYFAEKKFPFMMEVCHRREMDKKGGHLAKAKGAGFVLRERAQALDSEIDQFEDITKYSYFNSNSIWVNITFLKKLLDEKGAIELPLIANKKYLNPQDNNSPEVYQIETAMGSAISLFEGATAIEIPQERFRPVKKSNDLHLLWSDRFALSEEGYIEERNGVTKSINLELDNNYFAMYHDLKERVKATPPSLKKCTSLTIIGDFAFGEQITFIGSVTLKNESSKQILLENRTFENETILF